MLMLVGINLSSNVIFLFKSIDLILHTGISISLDDLEPCTPNDNLREAIITLIFSCEYEEVNLLSSISPSLLLVVSSKVLDDTIL